MSQREADPRRVCEGGSDATVAAYLICSEKETEVRMSHASVQQLTGTGNNST